jgi:ABC-2 type transport system permease protein
MAEVKNKNKRQQQALFRIVIMAAILICANVLASYFHTGIDLTKEKRFTLSAPTVKLLKNLHEVAVIDVYLQGKFPAGLQRLQEAVRERLRSFKDIAGNKIIFRFSDPFEGKNDNEKKQVARELNQKGIVPLELQTEDNDEYSMKVFFPYALVRYNGKEMPIMLIEDKSGRSSPAEKIGYSETMLEYKFANALNLMSKPDIAHVAYIIGNGEPLGVNAMDMLSSVGRRYYLDTVDLAHVREISLAYDAIIIAQPTEPFTGPEKLRIDQYVMRGGHVLWSLNMVKASLDSFRNNDQSQFMAMEAGLDLDDILFSYGVRVNKDLVEDKQNLALPRKMNNGESQLHDWLYFPKLNPTTDHPIVKNMDFIKAEFTNSIDTTKSPDIKKTILLQTSKYSLKADAPIRVSMSMMNYQYKTEMFTKSYLPVAVLLEGKFHSVYDHKLAPEYLRFLDSMKQPFKPSCDSANSMIVVSAGNIFMNGYTPKDGVQPMGYYWGTHEYFANRNFLLNCLEYLTDHTGVLEARSKEVKLRLLDTGRAKDEKSTWQAVNVGIPIAMVLVFASAYLFFRKRRYESVPGETKPISS